MGKIWGARAFVCGLVIFLFHAPVRAQMCGAPLSLNDFYGIRGSGYEVFHASIQGQFLLLLGHKVSNPNDRWPVFVQDLGANSVLDTSDQGNYGFLGEFFIHPSGIKISPQGWVAFVVTDPMTLGRTLPYSPTTEVPGDRVLYVCHYMNCTATLYEVHRHHPRDNPYYFTQPFLNFMLDGAITRYEWDAVSNNLIYSYVQYDNGMSLNQPWVPAYAVLNPPTPQTAIATYTPGVGPNPTLGLPASTALHESPIPYGSGDGLVMSQNIQSGSDRYIANRSNGTSLGGNSLANIETIVFDPDPTFPVPPANTHSATSISSWTEDPNVPGFFGWHSDPTKIALGTVAGTAGQTEMVAVRTVLEPSATAQNRLHDAVFLSSSNGFTGSDIAITPVNDGRDVKSVFQMDRPVPTVAIETSVGMWGLARTDLYQYAPSGTAGVPGAFQFASSVPIVSPDRFWLRGVSQDYVIGYWDRFSPYRRDLSLVYCP